MNASTLHTQAMHKYDRAILLRRQSDPNKAHHYFLEALKLESQAADLVASDENREPTRSILHRSAATIAIECREYRQAEKLISRALAGSPPNDLAEELRDLLEAVHFGRHLETKGIQLSSDEIQLSLSGRAVGFGLVEADEFIDRFNAIEKIFYRTAERKQSLPYRKSGSPPSHITRDLQLYLSTNRAASFATTIRIGTPKIQSDLPFDNYVEELIEAVLDCLNALNSSDDTLLDQLIPEKEYRKNFIALAKQVAPDRDDISQVGIVYRPTTEKTREISLRRSSKDIHISKTPPQPQNRRTVTGELLHADATRAQGRIVLIDDDNTKHQIAVDKIQMNDIVRPLFGRRVEVSGRVRKFGAGEFIQLDEIHVAK